MRGHIKKVKEIINANKKIRAQNRSLPNWSLQEREKRAYEVCDKIMCFITDSNYVKHVMESADPSKGVYSIHCFVSLGMALTLAKASNSVGDLLDDQFDNIPGSLVFLTPDQHQPDLEVVKRFRAQFSNYEEKGMVPLVIHLEILLNDLGPANTDSVQQTGAMFFSKNGVKPLTATSIHENIKSKYPEMNAKMKEHPEMVEKMFNIVKQMKECGYTNQEIVQTFSQSTGRTEDDFVQRIKEVNQHIADTIRFCATCNKAGYTFKKCGRCKGVFYCSKECQKTDWGQHKKGCK